MMSRIYALNKATLLVMGILTVSLIARLYHLDTTSLWGDELDSLYASTSGFGHNLHSLLYFVILHFWTYIGVTEFWLRLPAVLFGAATVIVLIPLGERFGGKAVGTLAALLLATSSYHIAYSQEIRFYSLFTLTASLSLLTFLNFVRDRKRMNLIYYLIAAILCIFSHLFGILVIAIELLYFVIAERGAGKQKMNYMVILGFLVILSLAVILFRENLFNVVLRFVGGYTKGTSEIKGLSTVNFLKIPLTFFLFIVGENTYPLNFALVIPALLVFLSFLGWGSYRLFVEDKKLFQLVTLWFLLPLILGYLVFDSIVSKDFVALHPKYMIFLLPVLYILVAKGIVDIKWKNIRFVSVAAVIGMNIASDVLCYTNSYSFNEYKRTDWKTGMHLLTDTAQEKDLILCDGRSKSFLDYYYKGTTQIASIYPSVGFENPAELKRFHRVWLIQQNWKKQELEYYNRFLWSLQKEFNQTIVYYSYPMSLHLFQRKRTDSCSIDERKGVIDIPAWIPRIEYMDLYLPSKTFTDGTGDGNKFPLSASFEIGHEPGDESQAELTFCDTVPANGIEILSHLIGGASIRQGLKVASIDVYDVHDSVQIMDLQAGRDVSDWAIDGLPNVQHGKAKVRYTWTKRMRLAGSGTAYPGVYNEYQAHIYESRLKFSRTVHPKKIKLRYNADAGVLRVWGLRFF